MAKRKKRHLSPAGFLLSLVLLIVIIFVIDAIARFFLQTDTENIVSVGSFADTEEETDVAEEDAEEGTETEEDDSIILELTAEDEANGTLILVDDEHPYTATTSFGDFSSISDSNVITSSTSLPIREEILDDLCTMFDAYASYNGSANLEIYSTTSSTLSSESLYTNSLPDRDTGYSFDIGLITSTGEIAAYIQEHNEWMVSNSWEYGFILRYPSDKTETTGVSYAPHHFRYVGQPHAAIMNDNDFCLEEYLTFLQSYTMDVGGYSYVYNDQSYLIYYIPADESGVTTVTLSTDVNYTVSGDNQGGFILTIINGTTEETETEETTESTSEY